MRRTLLLALFAAVAAGCGRGQTKVADQPTEEMIRADQDEQKKVESEERGTPIKARKK